MSHTDLSTAARPRTRVVVEGAVWLILFVVMWVYSYSFERDLETYAWGTVSWPRAIILVASVVALLSFVEQYRRLAPVPDDPAVEDSGQDLKGPAAVLRIGGTFIWPLVYLWLLPRTGYYATTPFFIAGYMLIFGQRRWRRILAVTVGIYAALLLVFTKLLFVPLPTGNWPLFYDFSNAFLVLIGR